MLVGCGTMRASFKNLATKCDLPEELGPDTMALKGVLNSIRKREQEEILEQEQILDDASKKIACVSLRILSGRSQLPGHAVFPAIFSNGTEAKETCSVDATS